MNDKAKEKDTDEFEDLWDEFEKNYGVQNDRTIDLEDAVVTLPSKASAQAKKPVVIPEYDPLPVINEHEAADEDTPQLEVVEATSDEIQSELLFLLADETTQAITNYDFERIMIKASGKAMAAGIFMQLSGMCQKEGLDMEKTDITIIISKRTGIDYNGRKMEEKSRDVIHSLLNNFPDAVTVIND